MRTLLTRCWQALVALVCGGIAQPPRPTRSVRDRVLVVFTLWRRLGLSEAEAWDLARQRIVPMAGGVDTQVPAGATEAAQAWADDIWLEVPERAFWGPYMQEDVDSIIQMKKELERGPGETITFTLARQLSTNGIQGDGKLEDNEEAVTWYSATVTIDQFRNAVRLRGRMSEKRTAFEQRPVAKQLLRDWVTNFADSRIFTTLSTSPTNAVYGGTATSTATIQSGDYLTLALISRAKTRARKLTPQIFPVNIDGGSYFLLAVSPDSLHDLKTLDPAWAQAQREAQVRGDRNPIFTGAEGIWDSVVIRSSTRVSLTTDWGSGANLNGAENLLCGRQTGVWAWGKKPDWVEQAFDYMNKTGYALGAIFEIAKATFNGQDNGLVAVRTFRSNI